MRDGSGTPRIVLAEDDPTNQFVIRAILVAAGFAVEVCENGQTAVECAQRDHPDVILMDLMMPTMDGYEAARTLSSDPGLDGVPLIAVTARAMPGDEEKALAAGFDGYITKPVSRRALIESVMYWLSRPVLEWMPDRLRKRNGFQRIA
jgi:two-component system cell cycle response regulator DivK